MKTDHQVLEWYAMWTIMVCIAIKYIAIATELIFIWFMEYGFKGSTQKP